MRDLRDDQGQRALPKVRLLALLLLTFTLTLTAAAQASTINKDKASPVVGETIVFTEFGGSDCASTYTWHADDRAAVNTGSANTYSTSFDTAGDHTVTVDVIQVPGSTGSCAPQHGTTGPFTVRPALGGAIAVNPDPPRPNTSLALTASATGGSSPFKFAWDTDNDGQFDDNTTPEGTSGDRFTTVTFPAVGPRVVKVRITDNAPAPHVTVVTRTLDVADPPPPPPTPPGSTTTTTTPAATTPQETPPPPPPCTKRLTFAVSEFTTPGCFDETAPGSGRWTTTNAVKLNGIAFPDFGQTFTITTPTAGEPGGHFTAPDSSIVLGDFVAFSGDVDWTLPDGTQGQEKTARTFTVAAGARLFALDVRGTIALRLGYAADGQHYATFPLTIELPASFRAGPDPSLGRVTGSAALRVDDAGVHFDGLKLQAKDVWIGRLKVVETCFSFSPAGGQSVDPCAAPSLNGEPYITCTDDVSTDRWDGNAVLELPGGGAKIAAFGGLANSSISKLGGFATDLGRRAPIAPNVFLNTIGVGLCLSPPPLTLKGTVGISILPLASGVNTAQVDGSVTYTDGTHYTPWTLEIGGNVKVFDRQVGSGSVTLRAWGGFDFGLKAGVDLEGVASLEGGISGWVDSDRGVFSVEGFLKACLATDLCAEGRGSVSSTGAAGCIVISKMYNDYIVILSDPFRLRWETRVSTLSAGFGYNWSTKQLSVLGNSCDFSPFQPVRDVPRAAQAGTLSTKIGGGAAAVTLRVHGSDGPPKVVVKGPGGATFSSPQDGDAARNEKFVLAENKSDGTTGVVLLRPAAGTWTITAAPGATSIPTRMERSALEAPPTFDAQVRGQGASRSLRLVYAVPSGTSVRLVERIGKTSRTLVSAVRGRQCPGVGKRRRGSDELVLCADVPFHPGEGPGGVRKVQAIVTRGAVPLSQHDIASYRAPAQTLPARPGPMVARRLKAGIRVAFGRPGGASTYVVSAVLSDGRRLAYDLASTCQAVLIKGVPASVAATVKVAGLRYDLEQGHSRTVTLKAGATSATPKGKLPLRVRKPKKVCS